MAHETFNSAFVQTVANLIGDAAELIQKEIALARAEIAAKISERVESVAWFAVAGILGFVVLLLVAEAAVFGLVAAGLAPGWASLIIAAAAAILAAAAFAYGKSAARTSPMPTRSLHQINQDIRTVKEQLS
ncbi:MAG TPA: phage holin family protein [Xanthobacteraceae bacterium]|nr:phage holin family protein [Xanthobacteraceae bacterium]